MLVVQSCPTFCDPMDSLLVSSVHGILQSTILEWVAVSFSRGSSQPRDQTWVSELQADSLSSEPPECFLLSISQSQNQGISWAGFISRDSREKSASKLVGRFQFFVVTMLRFSFLSGYCP